MSYSSLLVPTSHPLLPSTKSPSHMICTGTAPISAAAWLSDNRNVKYTACQNNTQHVHRLRPTHPPNLPAPRAIYDPQTLAWPLPPSPSSPNRKLTLLTQCRSSVGVGYPSPLNTCPKWPPQLLHTISVRCIPNAPSTCRVTAPGMLSK